MPPWQLYMEKIISYQNKKIVYHTYGSGKSVMLVHGFGEDWKIWSQQTVFLKDKFHIIVPELPGTGESETIEDMSMEGMAEVLHAIIHEEMPPQTPPKEGLRKAQGQLTEKSITKEKSNLSESPKVLPPGEDLGGACTMIGHSMGGYITLALAEKYWNHLDAFGLIHSTAFADNEEKKSSRKKGIEFIKQYGAFEFLKTITPNLFSPDSQLQIADSINKHISNLAGFSPDSLIAYYHAMMQRPDRTDILKNTDKPVLFIAGTFDIAVPIEDSLKQCHLPVQCHFHVLKKSGHMGMMEEPEKINRFLEEFLSGY